MKKNKNMLLNNITMNIMENEPQQKAKEFLDKMNVIHYVKLGGENQESKGLPVLCMMTKLSNVQSMLLMR